MRYRVQFVGQRSPAFMVAASGVIIHATHKLHWTLGHDFQDVHRILKTLNATWVCESPRCDKPRHGHWLDYTGKVSEAVIEDPSHGSHPF